MSMTSTMPQMVSSVFPTAYVTVYPRPGIWLLARSLIMPSEAVVVRAPEQHPSTIASWKRNTYFPTYIARISGTVVTATPQRNRLKPSCWGPAPTPGRDARPPTAMNMFRPTEFMNHTVDDGIRPKVGCTERSQPKNSPEISAPPEVDRVSGTLPIL